MPDKTFVTVNEFIFFLLPFISLKIIKNMNLSGIINAKLTLYQYRWPRSQPSDWDLSIFINIKSISLYYLSSIASDCFSVKRHIYICVYQTSNAHIQNIHHPHYGLEVVISEKKFYTPCLRQKYTVFLIFFVINIFFLSETMFFKELRLL